jgi:hypothetical protein
MGWDLAVCAESVEVTWSNKYLVQSQREDRPYSVSQNIAAMAALPATVHTPLWPVIDRCLSNAYENV